MYNIIQALKYYMKKCKMISLDTSSVASGWAYFENGILKEHGVIYKDKTLDKEDNLYYMCRNLIELLKYFKPHIIVIEMTVVERNAQVQRLLSEIVGVVRCYAIMHKDVDFVRKRPTEWRKLTKDEYYPEKGKKVDLKKWSVEKVKRDYGIECDDNEADAILIGQARINEFSNL